MVMISKKSRSRWNTKVVLVITALISAALIAFALFIPDEFSNVSNILVSIACSVWASNLIMWATSEFMIRNTRRKEDRLCCGT